MNIPLNKPFLGKEEEERVLEVIKSGNLLLGNKVEEFEKNFASYLGMRQVIGTSSGTSALYCVLKSNGIGNGDEVITTPLSFIATANSILHVGAKPVFTDINEETYNIDPDLIEKKITKKTKAILPVSLYGQPCNMDRLAEIAAKHNLILIEDAAQSHGSEFKGKKTGAWTTSSVFSFDPTKNLATCGGGAVVTNDEKVVEISKMLRIHGAKIKGQHDILGFNFKMNDIAAAIGIEQLKKLNIIVDKKIKTAQFYTKSFSDLNWIITPKVQANSKHSFHKYTIRIVGKNREEVIKKLNDAGVGTGIFYNKPIHKQKLYLDLGYKDNLPVVEKIIDQVLSLPIHPNLKKEDLDYISEIMHSIK